MLNLAAIHEALAAAHPERECLVFRDRRLSWTSGGGHRPGRAGRSCPVDRTPGGW